LLFYQEGTLMAQPFDDTLRQFTGDPFPVAEEIGHEGSRYASFSASDTGVLVFASGLARPTTRLTWMDRAGRTLSTIGDPAAYQSLAMSSDERLLAVALSSGNPENRDIWIVDIMRGTPTRFTFDAGDDFAPVWAPDNTRVAFQSLRQGNRTLRQKRVDGSSNEEILLASAVLGLAGPTDWSADGRHIAFAGTSQGAGALTDIWALPLFGERKPFPLVSTPPVERQATFSPDGRWFAYQSVESGQVQIYVQPFPPTGGKFQVSKDGGAMAAWRQDGKELFFLSSDSKMMAATVDTTGQFQHGVPTPLFTVAAGENNAAGIIGKQYAVTKDGQRFLVNVNQQQSNAIPLTVVVNWLAAVQK
jgi:Tol biopolymer transport system component